MSRGEMLRHAHDAMESQVMIKENKQSIYPGQLFAGCTETDIDRFFNGYGRLNQILMRNSFCKVFIDDAEDAVKDLKGRKIRGEKIIQEVLEKGEKITFTASQDTNWKLKICL